MSERRADRRRAGKHAFRPAVDGQLEDRKLMTVHTYLYPPNHIQTAFNGSAVDITTPEGQSFLIEVTNSQTSVRVADGTIKAYAMGGGKFGLVVYGTDINSELTINPVINHRFKGTAHKYNSAVSNYTSLINIGAITVANGIIGDIEGYKTAILSGPLLATSAMPVNRIAFDEIAPGASILTGGDLDTLDIGDSVYFSGAGTGLVVGRDLNYFDAPGDVTITNGAVFSVGRDVGLSLQPAKGTGPGPGQGIILQGNLTISNGSKFVVGRNLDPVDLYNVGFNTYPTISINGQLIGYSNITVGFTTPVPGTIVAVGGGTPIF